MAVLVEVTNLLASYSSLQVRIFGTMMPPVAHLNLLSREIHHRAVNHYCVTTVLELFKGDPIVIDQVSNKVRVMPFD